MEDRSQQPNTPNRQPAHPAAWVWIALAALGLILWIAFTFLPKITAGAGNSGQSRLDFTVKDLTGETVKLRSMRGKTVLVNFWATWCSPCKEEMPLLQSYYDAHHQDGFVLVGVNVSDDVEDARAFIEEYGYTFPVWSDPPGNVLIDLGMNGLPASLVISPDGTVVKRWIGPLTQKDLDEVITPLLTIMK